MSIAYVRGGATRSPLLEYGAGSFFVRIGAGLIRARLDHEAGLEYQDVVTRPRRPSHPEQFAVITIDPVHFDDDSIDAETRAINAAIVERLADYDQWSMPPAKVRELRKEGLGPFPLAPHSELARVETIDGPGGPLPLRIIDPGGTTGVYLHIHGGGWVLGSPEEQDPRLERLARACNVAVISVDYRLAPEHPYPAAPDDCEAAALWLLGEGGRRFDTGRLFIGGESAGAHLSVVTLLRLRDRHGLTPFHGANLTAGCYDLALSPSVRRWGTEKLILNTRDITMFTTHFLGQNGDASDPDVSPIHADLSGLPPALFVVGTRDPLVDDTLFMAARWTASGNRTDLEVYPGGAHVFIAFTGRLAEQGLTRIEGFLNRL